MRQGDLVGLIELSRYAEKQLLSSLGSSIDLGPLLCVHVFVFQCVCACVCVCARVFERDRKKRKTGASVDKCW